MSKFTMKGNWPRKGLQLSVLAFIIFLIIRPFFDSSYTPDFEAYCPFGGIQALGSFFLNGSLACTMTSSQIVMGILLAAAIIVLSKLFCSYVCPIGTITEWLGKLGEKLKIRITVKGIADKALRSLKYILLFITLYFTLGSSELFCKKFDPYFAATTGFGADVVVLYAVISLIIVIFGSIFFRLFWCKYLCPLAAISNIFKFFGLFVIVVGIYVGLILAGVEISYVWPLAVISVGGYILEIYRLKTKVLPFVHITRNTDTCINCQLCSKKCPQAIDVANLKTVKHVDCNLCNECVVVCPVENTLNLNKKDKLKWMPSLAVIVLVIAGITMGASWEVPTIDLQWGDKAQIAEAGVFTQSGLKNIKCYGSSMAFANKMKRVNGVLGVATYVGHHRVKIYYDPNVLDDQKIQEDLFTPMKAVVKPIAKDETEVKMVSMSVDNFFDPYDFNYLQMLLKQQTDAVGVQMEFACPVIVRIYLPGSSDTSFGELVDAVESKILTYQVRDKEQQVKLDYEVVGDPEVTTISKEEYVKRLFKAYDQKFNKMTKYNEAVIDTLSVPTGNFKFNQKWLPYLVSHLSGNDGVVEFRTSLDDSMNTVFNIMYIDSSVTADDVLKAMQVDTLVFTYSSGKKGKIANMFSGLFDEE